MSLNRNLVMASVEVSGTTYNQPTVTGQSSLKVGRVWVKRQLVCKKRIGILMGVFWQDNNFQIESVQVQPECLLLYQGPGELIQEERGWSWGRDTHQCFTTESRPVWPTGLTSARQADTHTKTLLLLLDRDSKKEVEEFKTLKHVKHFSPGLYSFHGQTY